MKGIIYTQNLRIDSNPIAARGWLFPTLSLDWEATAGFCVIRADLRLDTVAASAVFIKVIIVAKSYRY
jgi:hypothetical protein